MAVSPILTGDLQELFYRMPEPGEDTDSITGIPVASWEDIYLLDNSFYRFAITGHFTATTLTTMQLAFELSETPSVFIATCRIFHDATTPVVENLNTPGDFTSNTATLDAAVARPFLCEGLLQTQSLESTLTVNFRSILASNEVSILPGSVLWLQQFRLPMP